METNMKTKFVILTSLLVLSACAEEHSDLQSWMQKTKAEAKSKIKPPQAPEPLQPVTYFPPSVNGPHAFNSQKLKAAFQNSSAPDMNRSKELLENYSLENLRFIGSIGTAGNLSGLIEVDADGEKKVYTVKPGNYLGQNYGKISKITSDKIDIIEVVENAEGNWENRSAELIATPAQ